jgi:hypothetical protein
MPDDSSSPLRGAAAGAAAAAAWAAADPLLARALRSRYSTRALLGTAVTRHPAAAAAVGVAAHLLNGAAFGAAFARLGGAGPRAAVAAAQAENLSLWPAMALADRLHPARRDGRLPPLFRGPRVFAHEAAAHLLFGLVLGALTRRPPARAGGYSS